ncbi:NAD(P)/FAD-dependent oxidoreductase [Kordiimonas sp.]|uniref:NAD(P)/FAD-dependent oxidoreductase n=1 Tax=Kordiimonas sp. TaxID=1970157 RepID=UPI003B525A48
MADTSYDIIIIGAGMAGASLGAELAAHRNILLIEREEQPGYHSTGRSAALFSEIYGSKAVRALSRASKAFFENPPEGFAEAPLLNPRGTMFVATPLQAEALDGLKAQPDVAAHTRWISAKEAVSYCPVLKEDALIGALYEDGSADIDVHGLHQGYLKDIRRKGGDIQTGTTVSEIKKQSGNWRVTTGAGCYSAPVVVNAAGAWADEIGTLAGARSIGLKPKRRTAILVAPPPEHNPANWPMVMDIGEEFYFKPDAGHLLVSPCDETETSACDAQAEELDVAIAADRLMTATSINVRRIEHRWAGLRSFVADRTPVAGFDKDAEGFFWLAGQGGYGIQTAPALARFAAGLILTGEPDPALKVFGVIENALKPDRLWANV